MRCPVVGFDHRVVPYGAQGANSGYTSVPARSAPGPRVLPPDAVFSA